MKLLPMLVAAAAVAPALGSHVPAQQIAERSIRSTLLLVSGGAAAYLGAEKGVVEGLNGAASGAVRTVNLGSEEGEAAGREALAVPPTLIVAVGTRAARLARQEAPGVPLVYAMVLDPASAGLPGPGETPGEAVTGVAMDVTLRDQLALLREMIPGLKRIGVLYDPSVSGPLVRRAEDEMRAMGLTLTAQPVRSEAEVIGAAGLIAPEVDVLWAIPDVTVLTSANARALILLALRSRKPLLAMSEGYVRHGALAALAAHPYEVGRRAGEMATSILSGTPVQRLKPEMPPRVDLFVNVATAQRLGLELPDAIVSRAGALYPRQ
ncbi:MAG TPA: ABC transporter substrate-binding protein [Candidatus Polarisedimenticolia bacterium]|nr:ABC transporter substrate-binding protein [Candidatus Polarisedimenticolia bacterium]